MEEEGYVRTDGNNGSVVHLTPALRDAIAAELTRGLVAQFVAEAKANHMSYKKVIGLVQRALGGRRVTPPLLPGMARPARGGHFYRFVCMTAVVHKRQKAKGV